MTDFASLEEVDAVRLSWNVWPNSKLEAAKCIVPFGAMYSPNKRLPNMPVSPTWGVAHIAPSGTAVHMLPAA